VTVSLAQAAILLANARKPTSFTTLVHRVYNPVDSGITTNGFVVGINEDDLVVLVNTILVNPVRVQHPQISTSLANTLLRCAPETTLEFQMVNTLANGFAVGGTLGHRLFSVTAPDTDTVDNVALLGFVAESTSLVRARWTGCAVDDVQLAVFPAPEAEEEAKDIRLFLLVQLSDVLVRTHLEGLSVES